MSPASEVFDLSLIRGKLKRLFKEAGVDIPAIYLHLSETQKKEMPIETVLNWFHYTREKGVVTNLVQKTHIEAFLNASILAIRALDGTMTDAQFQRYIVRGETALAPRRLSSRNPS